MSAIALGALALPFYLAEAVTDTVADLARWAWNTGRRRHRTRHLES